MRASAISERSGATAPACMFRMVAPFEKSPLPQAKSAQSPVSLGLAARWTEQETRHGCGPAGRYREMEHLCIGSTLRLSPFTVVGPLQVFASSRWPPERYAPFLSPAALGTRSRSGERMDICT